MGQSVSSDSRRTFGSGLPEVERRQWRGRSSIRRAASSIASLVRRRVSVTEETAGFTEVGRDQTAVSFDGSMEESLFGGNGSDWRGAHALAAPNIASRTLARVSSPVTTSEGSANIGPDNEDIFWDMDLDWTSPVAPRLGIGSNELLFEHEERRSIILDTPEEQRQSSEASFGSEEHEHMVSGTSDRIPSHAYLLGRLLAVAAHLTATSLVGGGRTSSGWRHGAPEDAPAQENSFSSFIDTLLSGTQASQLANTMFGDQTQELPPFFRMFCFPPQDHGLIPVVIMGTRAMDQRPRTADTSTEETREVRGGDIDSSFSGSILPYLFGGTGSMETTHDQGRPAASSRHGFRYSQESSHSHEFDNEESTAGGLSDRFGHNTVESPEGRRPAALDSPPHSTGGNTRRTVYVVGTAYPPSHPLFSAARFNTDNPTYEDLLLVESLLVNGKPFGVSQQDLDETGGLFTLNESSELVLHRESCPICFVGYAPREICRALICHHTFHKTCVDRWIIDSHNSCPLCRGQAVPRPVPPHS